MALGARQPLIEISIRNLSGYKERLASQLSRKCGLLDVSQLHRPSWPVTWVASLLKLL
jgi:hypothetical protein